jgi:hypothetical protein
LHKSLHDTAAKKMETLKKMKTQNAKKDHANLGIIRLDYNYPAAPGDMDCPETFTYDVFYRAVPGLTFDMCQGGIMTRRVQKEFTKAIDYLVNEKNVSGISGDCGFMMFFQEYTREHQHTRCPVFLSALAQLPAVTCAFGADEKIIIVTANGETLKPMSRLIARECGVDIEDDRFVILGAQDVPGFEAVALGEKVDVDKVTPGMVALCQNAVKKHPTAKAFLFECTELPPYSDAVRHATGLPVYDAVTNCDFFITGFQDNERFGIKDWQKNWDGQQEDYEFGQELTRE